MKNAENTAANPILAPDSNRWDQESPTGCLSELASVPAGPYRERGPDALFKDEAGKLFLGYTNGNCEVIPGSPLVLVSPLNGLRWVRDQLPHRNRNVKFDEIALIDVAIAAIHELDDELTQKMEMWAKDASER